MSKELFFKEREAQPEAGIGVQLTRIRDNAVNGESNPLDAYIYLKQIEDIVSNLKESLQPLACDEAEKFNGTEYRGYNPSVTLKTTYSYDHIERWNKLNKEKKEVEDSAKAILLKCGGVNMANIDTGELVEAAKIKSVSKVLTLRKAK